MTDNKMISTEVAKALGDASNMDWNKAADALLKDVEQAKESMSKQEFDQYQKAVSEELTRYGLIPRLSVGYLKSHFQEIETGTDGISKQELSRYGGLVSRFGTGIEKMLLASAQTNFASLANSLPEGYSSTALLSEAELQHLNTKHNNEQMTRHDGQRLQTVKEYEVRNQIGLSCEIAKVLYANNGELFKLIAEDGSLSISKDVMQSFINDQKSKRQNGIRTSISPEEFKNLELLMQNWDKQAGANLRRVGDTNEITLDRVKQVATAAIAQEKLLQQKQSATDNNLKSTPIADTRKTPKAKTTVPPTSRPSEVTKKADSTSPNTELEYTVKANQGYWHVAKDILSDGGKKQIANADISRLTRELQERNQNKVLHPNDKIVYCN